MRHFFRTVQISRQFIAFHYSQCYNGLALKFQPCFEENPMNSLSAITLLIVDDEAEIRTGLRSIIPWEDYSVTVIGTAASGAEALDKIRYYEPNIVTVSYTHLLLSVISRLPLFACQQKFFQTSIIFPASADTDVSSIPAFYPVCAVKHQVIISRKRVAAPKCHVSAAGAAGQPRLFYYFI